MEQLQNFAVSDKIPICQAYFSQNAETKAYYQIYQQEMDCGVIE